MPMEATAEIEQQQQLVDSKLLEIQTIKHRDGGKEQQRETNKNRTVQNHSYKKLQIDMHSVKQKNRIRITTTRKILIELFI